MLARTVTLLFLLLCSCGKQDIKEIPAQVIDKDGIHIELTPSLKSLRTCDLLEITIEVTYPQTYKLKLPDSKSNYGDFSIYQINQNSPIALNETLNKLSQVIILEPGLPATHKLPELTFNFWNEDNVQTNFKSEPFSFEVVSTINGNKDIEDIITKTEKPDKSVLIIGSSALGITIIYLLFFTKLETTSKSSPLKEALEKFKHLKNLNETQVLKEIPKVSCNILKEKFSLHDLPDNLDVIIKELSTNNEVESLSKRLQELLNNYNKVRYSSKDVDQKSAQDLWVSFDEFFRDLDS